MPRISNSPGVLLDVANLLVADSTAMAALRLGSTGPMAQGPGTGADGMDANANRVTVGTTILRKTQILVDFDGLISAATDNDVIGESAGANAHIGQVTAAEFGTVLGGSCVCLQAPTGGELDIDLYANSSGTIAQSADGTGGTALFEIGTNWTVGATVNFTGVPTANHYLYLTVGTASTPTGATYTAGVFLITFYGV